MKVNKIILYFLAFGMNLIHAEIMRHTLISITEQKVAGYDFKHTITSGSADKDKFFIDADVVSKDYYYKEYEDALKKEREAEIEMIKKQARLRLDFVDTAQVEIVAKLINKSLMNAYNQLYRVKKSSLEKFYMFSSKTVDSLDQLNQLESFLDQIKNSVSKWIEESNFDLLHNLYNRLEPWPIRLENFLQDTIQCAIKQSDDTAMLKELLALVSE